MIFPPPGGPYSQVNHVNLQGCIYIYIHIQRQISIWIANATEIPIKTVHIFCTPKKNKRLTCDVTKIGTAKSRYLGSNLG